MLMLAWMPGLYVRLAKDSSFSLSIQMSAKLAIPNVEVARVHVAWQPPLQFWTKINIDRFVVLESTSVAYVGIIRDEDGAFMAAWNCKLGDCSITLTELSRVFWGLHIDRNMNLPNVILETDSFCVHSLTTKVVSIMHAYGSFVNAIRDLMD